MTITPALNNEKHHLDIAPYFARGVTSSCQPLIIPSNLCPATPWPPVAPLTLMIPPSQATITLKSLDQTTSELAAAHSSSDLQPSSNRLQRLPHRGNSIKFHRPIWIPASQIRCQRPLLPRLVARVPCVWILTDPSSLVTIGPKKLHIQDVFPSRG